MAVEKSSRREILEAIKGHPALADLLEQDHGHYRHELDLEVCVYGRNYGGKKVGPYFRLLRYEPDEIIIREEEWGGNCLFVVIQGTVDVLVHNDTDGRESKVAELPVGTTFGEMAVLAGVPRNATVKAPATGCTEILEIQRPALRLLRKLDRFGADLDRTYRSHGRDATLQELADSIGLPPNLRAELKEGSVFRVYSKNHLLFREGAPMDRIYLFREGWLRRDRNGGDKRLQDYLGPGHCFGLDALSRNSTWPYSMTLLDRSEVLEVSVARVRRSIPLRDILAQDLVRYVAPQMPDFNGRNGVRLPVLTSQKTLIETGIASAGNLLIMDMDLCIRCGNCSLACHKVHGQSRLLRKGLHFMRQETSRLIARQSVLAPSVCMHCKDPECLTGCPTGAIGRFAGGEVDIDSKTCIGCGDCATQCPYDAISMIARGSSSKTADPTKNWKWRLRDLFRLSADPLPPEVSTSEDLLAVKCNLCSDRTGMNPPGSKSPAYSCEENCPTGALARIDPKRYFAEIGEIEGFFRLDTSHAVGRNIHREDRQRRRAHLAGVGLTVLVTALTILGFMEYGMGARLVSFLNMRWITGLVGLLGIIGVMLYPVRRQIYQRRAGPLRVWLLTHTYAGIIAAIMIFLHGGVRTGGLLTTALMWSFDVVVLTGFFGIGCYLVIPRLLTRMEEAPLLVDDLRLRRSELQKDLAEILSQPSEALRNLILERILPRFLTLRYLARQYWKREPIEVAKEAAKAELGTEMRQIRDSALREALAEAHMEDQFQKAAELAERPYPTAAMQPGSSLSQTLFRRPGEDPRVREAVESARRQERRGIRAVEAAVVLRRVDALIYLHRLLKIWLPSHVVTTSLMLALMIVHIVQVIYYAAR